MAGIDWLRLWHDMPNDPKWRTIARISEQPISLVVSVYVHMMVDASRNVTRGHTDVTDEDIASALDVTEVAIAAIRAAMQGRVLDGDVLSGWENRQPKREDVGNPETGAKSAAQRKREQRERLKSADASVASSESHDESQAVTQSHDREEKRREESKQPPIPPKGGDVEAKKSTRRKEVVSLQTFVDACHAAGEQVIPADDPVFTYAEEIGIPDDTLRLHWLEFRDRYALPEAKRYKDWRSVFRKSVRGNWLKLWYFAPDGACLLTTVGEQARRAHPANREAA
ncbi:hypothetical protein [Pandoraea sputorum]|uniref:Phage replisome organizer n=1 Tax=Pandoraea sputorum TaxID=93222 RepID=A0A5E5BCQ4_9BURK|nr:hypothetical protein [Pandoraea sputorum]VVE82882.1 hypothetical protein PSP31121_04015 [Pandoraea sputorum]